MGISASVGPGGLASLDERTERMMYGLVILKFNFVVRFVTMLFYYLDLTHALISVAEIFAHW